MPKFVQIELFYGDESQGGYVERESRAISLADLIDGLEPGDDYYRVSVVEMTDEELAALPEFNGF